MSMGWQHSLCTARSQDARCGLVLQLLLQSLVGCPVGGHILHALCQALSMLAESRLHRLQLPGCFLHRVLQVEEIYGPTLGAR